MYKVCHGPHPPQCARAPTGSFAWRGGRTSLATRLSSTSSRACVVSGFRHEVRHSTLVPWCNDATARRRWPLGLFQRARGTGCGVQAVGTLAKCDACTGHVPLLPPPTPAGPPMPRVGSACHPCRVDAAVASCGMMSAALCSQAQNGQRPDHSARASGGDRQVRTAGVPGAIHRPPRA